MPSTGNIRLAHKGIAALEALHRADQAHQGDDQQALAGWPGWGPFAPAFETEVAEEWVPVAERLADLLDDEAYETAKLCVDNSFYTSQAVVDLVYRLLAETGAGEVARTRPLRALEPGCGSGRFIAGAPTGWRLEWTGVEADKTSAAIAQAFHPEATIVAKRLERLAVPDDSFDLAVGNVPFSSQHVFDPVGQKYLSLHNYFIDRALAAVHDGGYLAFVISRFAMDGQEILSVLQGKAALVGAIRLPSGTFRSEGTNVVADLVFIRKGVDMAGWRPRARAGKLSVPGPTPDVLPASVSSYWADYPDRVAGQMVASKHFRNGLRVNAGPEPDRDIERAVSSLAAELSARPWRPGNVAPRALEVVTDDEGRPEGSFALACGKVYQVVGGRLSEVRRPSAELRALVELRDAAKSLLELEADLDLPDSALAGPRAKARELYDAYVARYGPLNRGTLHEGAPDPDTGMATLSWRRLPMGGFRRDPGYITVLALEHFDQDTGEARPAAILTGRVNRRPAPIESAETPAEALAVSLGETGDLDLARVASLLSLAGPEEAASALGDLVYADPAQGGSYVPARDYLSGNVRAKLAAAEQAAANDPRYERNVVALRSVLPAPLGPLEITVHLGAPWVGAQDIEAFLADVLGRQETVEHIAATASWKVYCSEWGLPAAATTTWGTSRLNAYQLVEMALNGRTPVVYDEVWDGSTTKKVRNQEQTLAAIEKMAALDERFGTWVWEDAERAERICAEYNHRFNSHVLRKADGSHLRFPGLSAGVVPWRWQRDVVDRIVSTSPGTFCAHDVGLGKTLTMVLAAHTLRRFGLANKPLIVVPNHLLEQIAREAAQAFPLNRYLVAGKEDLAGDARRLFAARCATEDWDAVIMTHQGFTSLPVHPATEIAWLNEQKAELEDYLRSEGRSYSAKDIARALRSLQGRLEQLRDGVGDRGTVLFDQLGIDWIAVDECSAFRRLPIGARADGFSLGSSKRATDLLLKSQAIARRKPGMPCLALFSGTPWNNTLAEVFVWQTFLQPERLKEVGVSNFNAWAATFVKRETRVEVAPDGSGFRLATRPVGLQNLPELRSMFTEFMDIVHADATGIERPDAIVENVRALPSASQVAYVKGLVRRADKIRSGGVDRDKDNMLVVCNDGRKVALDPRLVGLDEPSPKLVAVADKVAEIYEETAEWDYDGSAQRGALQVVFCDQGTPGANGAQSYGRLRSMLVDRGVPASAVRWAHEAGTDKAKAALFAACREGKVAVLLASTEKAGLGTNIQTRLCAVHHVDAPWLPSLVAQRDGRAIRYGNMNEKVRIFRYVTEGTFDAYMWQALERKARSFQEISRSDSDVREVDDIGETVLSYGEVKALATGNPLVLRQAEIAAKVKRLRTVKAVESQGVTSAKRTMADASGRAKILAERAQALGKVAAHGASVGAGDARVLGRLARDIRALANSGDQSHAYRWHQIAPVHIGPVEVRVALGAEGTFNINYVVGYKDVYSQAIPRRAMRRSDEAAMATVVESVAWFLAHCPGLAEDLRASSAQAKRQAEDAERLVSSYAFSREGELREAERQLQEINLQIIDMAAAEAA